MDKERFLDVNGFNVEYDIPLEKRLNKYRNGRAAGGSGVFVPETERLQARSDGWRSRVRRAQIVTALVGAIAFALVVALSVYLTYGM